VQINEFHYDNINLDVNQFIELRHNEPLTAYEIFLYNGYNGLFYNRTNLTNIPPTTITPKFNYTVVPFGQIANDVEGIALKAPNGTVIEFISYEGNFTAKNGPAKGMQSVDINVSESNICTSIGYSLQKCTNNGLWIGPNVATPGKLNRNCTTLPVQKGPVTCGKVVPAPVAVPVKAPAASPIKEPASSPVKAPVTQPIVSSPTVTAPVVAPVAAPVTAPVMQPPTKPDTPTSKPEKCGLFKFSIFCPSKCGYIKRLLKLC
jgi:hypothetical protein